MNKFKYAAIIAIVAISAVIGTMSMKKNSPKTELSGLALANVEALTQSETTTVKKYQTFGYHCSMWTMDYFCTTTKTAETCRLTCR